jgi:hypothetical protein
MAEFQSDETKSKSLLEMGRRGGLMFVKGRWWGIWYVQGKEDCCRLINLWVALFIPVSVNCTRFVMVP